MDFLRIVSDPVQAGVQVRRILAEAQAQYLEFSRPPYAADLLDAAEVIHARQRGVSCRMLVERGTLDSAHARFLAEYSDAAVEVREVEKVPLKMAVMDGRSGLLALLDPVITRPGWTSIVFNHEGLGEAMTVLFENYWTRGTAVAGAGAV